MINTHEQLPSAGSPQSDPVTREEARKRADLLAAMPHGADRQRVAEICQLEADNILDFSANIFRPGFTPAMQEVLARDRELAVSVYPEPYGDSLRARLAEKRGLAPEQILLGNGGADLIFRLAAFLRTSPNFPLRSEVLILVPGFSDYPCALQAYGLGVSEYTLLAANDFLPQNDLLAAINASTLAVWLCQPQNPTGQLIDPLLLRELRRSCQDRGIYLIQDECFLDFLEPEERTGHSLSPDLGPRELVLKSFTKLYGMPGLRLGWLEAGSREMLASLKEQTPSWQVSGPALAVGRAALDTPEEELGQWRKAIRKERERLAEALREFGADHISGQANFLFFRHDRTDLQTALLACPEGPILIRNCAGYAGLGPGYFRIAVLGRRENSQLIAALNSLSSEAGTKGVAALPKPSKVSLKQEKSAARFRQVSTDKPQPTKSGQNRCAPLARLRDHKALAIMILGCSSSVGKSVFAVGLCRLLARQGFKVLPFKSQNMSEYVEMSDGRRFSVAQMQMAEAACQGYQPEMNPVLLCPRSEQGSDVYVLGRYWYSPSAGEYYRIKHRLWPSVEKSYRHLTAEADIVVVEGAGSPAEINLQQDDFVNLGLAQRLDLPCLLLGDIDKGGVFAALYGTLALTGELGAKQIKALVINKFRGDRKILDPGLRQFASLARKPLLGVVPFLPKLTLEREDTLSDDTASYSRAERETAYERLADALEESLDLELLTGILLQDKM